MTQIGRSALLECAEFVMELTGSKRMNDDRADQKKLLARLRLAEHIEDNDVKKLLSLHLDVIEELHSKKVVEEIQKKAIYLFFTNEKRIRHNLLRLSQSSGESNPVAIMKPHSIGNNGGKGNRKHFDSNMPETCMLCVGAMAAIENRNFCPVWGLHNGACGVVEEIVFEKGKNPNHGDLPLYVVVNFPLYCGPAWDKDRPKVNTNFTTPLCLFVTTTDYLCSLFLYQSQATGAVIAKAVAKDHACH